MNYYRNYYNQMMKHRVLKVQIGTLIGSFKSSKYTSPSEIIVTYQFHFNFPISIIDPNAILQLATFTRRGHIITTAFLRNRYFRLPNTKSHEMSSLSPTRISLGISSEMEKTSGTDRRQDSSMRKLFHWSVPQISASTVVCTKLLPCFIGSAPSTDFLDYRYYRYLSI